MESSSALMGEESLLCRNRSRHVPLSARRPNEKRNRWRGNSQCSRLDRFRINTGNLTPWGAHLWIVKSRNCWTTTGILSRWSFALRSNNSPPTGDASTSSVQGGQRISTMHWIRLRPRAAWSPERIGRESIAALPRSSEHRITLTIQQCAASNETTRRSESTTSASFELRTQMRTNRSKRDVERRLGGQCNLVELGSERRRLTVCDLFERLSLWRRVSQRCG